MPRFGLGESMYRHTNEAGAEEWRSPLIPAKGGFILGEHSRGQHPEVKSECDACFVCGLICLGS
jgi:hypothetical protein